METSVQATLQRIALDSESAAALDGYLWKVDSLELSVEADSQASRQADEANREQNAVGSQNTIAGSDDGYEKVAARQLIRWQTRSLDADNLEALDAVHAIAKRTGIVTPYSSMLVLVDERQREALKAAEAGEDRFSREVENGQDELSDPGSPLAASVPEPGQLLSLMVGAITLVLLKRRSELSR